VDTRDQGGSSYHYSPVLACRKTQREDQFFNVSVVFDVCSSKTAWKLRKKLSKPEFFGELVK
jgi:hypothetical protein